MKNNGWISIVDALPPIDPDVLVKQPWWTETDIVWAWGDKTSFGDAMFLAQYDYCDGLWYDENDNPIPTNSVRYWQPKPLPPEGCDWNLYPSEVERRRADGA